MRRTMERTILITVLSALMVIPAVVLAQTNLTVVRHNDSTLWKMTCEGAGICSQWTQIPGKFSVQPTLTWDPAMDKYILIGIGNNQTSIWRSTFNADGSFNNDWTQISGASPSPVALAAGNYDTLESLNCSPGQIPKWNGSMWACAADDGGSGMTPSSTVANLDGGSSAGASGDYSRGDHKHGITPGSITSAHIQDGQVTKSKLSATGGTSGQLLGTDGANLVWQNDASGFTLPYFGLAITNQGAFAVTNLGTNGTALWGLATDGLGVYGEGNGTPGYGVWGRHTGTGNQGTVGTALGGVVGVGTGNSRGVHGQSEGATGVHGQSGSGYGVYGESSSGYGIYGRQGGTGNYGLLGTYVAGAAGFGMGNARGVHAQSENATGVHGQSTNGYGVYGESTNGIAAAFRGNVQVLSKSTGGIVLEMGEGLDYAEGFDVSERNKIIPGTVLVIDPDSPGKLTTSIKPYDTRVAGIVAGAKGLGSGVRLGTGRFDLDVALAGRVYCNVDSVYGEVAPGDLLTTSPTPGHAMVVKDHTRAQGAILGKAMEKLGGGQKGQILVLVTLQ